MISAAELTAMQATAALSLDLTASTQRNTGTGTDAWGHPAETWTVVNASVACGLADPSPQTLQKHADLIGSARAFKASFAHGTDVARDDRIIVQGLTLRIQVDISPGSYSTLTQVLATQINEIVG